MSRLALLMLATVVAYVAAAPACAFFDDCGVCNGDNTSCNCQDYLGFPVEEVDLSLMTYVNGQLVKNIDTLVASLESLKDSVANVYDPTTERVNLADYIDGLHAFCSGRSCSDTECQAADSACSIQECEVSADCLSLHDFSLLQMSYLDAIKTVTGNQCPQPAPPMMMP